MAALQLIAAFTARAALIGESIYRSQSNTNSMVSILGSLDDHCFSALEAATQVRKQAIRMAYENIDKMLKSVEVILAQFDLTQHAESKILREPYEDLESYIKAMDQLRGVIQFFESNKSFKTSDGVVNLCNNLLVKSIPKLEEEFKQILTAYREARASCLEQSLQKLGVERLGKDDVQGIQWDVLEAKIRNWIHFMQIAILLSFSIPKWDYSRVTVKERFKYFNIQFEELHQRQSQWTVPDPELRESLRLAVAEVLLPAYSTFFRRGWIIKKDKSSQKYIRYTQEDLDRMLGELFEGKKWKERKRFLLYIFGRDRGDDYPTD